MTIKILLVDDNQAFAAAVRQFLDMLPGAEVVGHEHDGSQALGRIRQLQPDVVLLDIVMPGMNGLEVARALQSWPQAPRIVFLSLHDNTAYRSAARELGAADFVGKADFVTELLPIIERLVENSTARDLSC